jgi:hypothetical protein
MRKSVHFSRFSREKEVQPDHRGHDCAKERIVEESKRVEPAKAEDMIQFQPECGGKFRRKVRQHRFHIGAAVEKHGQRARDEPGHQPQDHERPHRGARPGAAQLEAEDVHAFSSPPS